MVAPSQQIHRRKSSRDEDENTIIIKPSTSTPAVPVITIAPVPPPRIRAQSTPHNHGHSRSSTNPSSPLPVPLRTNAPPRPVINGHPPNSPFRPSSSVPLQPYHANGHSRTRSISTPFSPTLPSPLSFPTSPPSPTMFPISYSAPDAPRLGNELLKSPRRHTRLHSRNLSFFFPRPGSIPHSTIDEDGVQELEVPVDVEAPLILSAESNIRFPGSRGARQSLTPLGQNFTFGARPPSSQGLTPELMTAPHSASSTSSSASRRGHHHKHSVSHNFFSFLEPGSLNHDEELHIQPTSRPLSPWGSGSALPASAASSKSESDVSTSNNYLTSHERHHDVEPEQFSYSAAAASLVQFVLGAWLWVSGQQVGSISCTGLGYWVVFDSFGVALAKVIPGWLSRSSNASFAEKKRTSIRRSYGYNFFTLIHNILFMLTQEWAS